MSRSWTNILDQSASWTSSSTLRKPTSYWTNCYWEERYRCERVIKFIKIKYNHSFLKETSKKAVLNQIEQADKFQEEEIVELALKDIGLI